VLHLYHISSEIYYTEWNLNRSDKKCCPAGSLGTSKIVVKLVKSLSGRGHTLQMDNYKSPDICLLVKQTGVNMAGTLWLNRKNVPWLQQMQKWNMANISWHVDQWLGNVFTNTFPCRWILGNQLGTEYVSWDTKRKDVSPEIDSWKPKCRCGINMRFHGYYRSTNISLDMDMLFKMKRKLSSDQ
jgi:hypothetical protein